MCPFRFPALESTGSGELVFHFFRRQREKRSSDLAGWVAAGMYRQCPKRAFHSLAICDHLTHLWDGRYVPRNRSLRLSSVADPTDWEDNFFLRRCFFGKRNPLPDHPGRQSRPSSRTSVNTTPKSSSFAGSSILITDNRTHLKRETGKTGAWITRPRQEPHENGWTAPNW